MQERRIGRLSLTLPDLGCPELYLTNVTHLDTGRGSVEDFQYIGEAIRDLDLTGLRLLTGRISGLQADRVLMEQTQLHSVEFTDCQFGTLRCADSKLSRVHFRACKLMGSAFEDTTLDNVLFENCRLDYATFTKVRAIGPVAFSKCILPEAEVTGNDLTETVLEGCTLRQTDFGPGTYRDTDLRGSDLGTVHGAINLLGSVIASSQEAELARALISGLDLTITDDPI